MQITFEFNHPVYGLYSDALNIPDDHTYTEDELNSMKQQRFDNWVAYLEAPPVELPLNEPPPEVLEELVEESIVEETPSQE